MVVPTLITGHAPHFGRAIGATPVVALLCALGGWTVWRTAASLERRWLQTAVALLLAVGFVFSGFSTARTYHRTWARSPDLFYAYDVGLTSVARYINTLPEDEEVYLTPTSGDHYTLEYLVQRSYASFDGRAGLVLPPPDQPATVLILVREDGATLPALESIRPDGQVTWTTTDGHGRPYATAYHFEPLAGNPSLAAPEYPASATLGGVARLIGRSLGAETVAPGDTVNLVLHWQALAPIDGSYTVFAHLLGDYNPATDGPVWAGHDGQPNAGHYPTAVWQPGEIILDVHPLAIPADTPPGSYQLEAGLYLLETMERLSAADAAGQPLPDNAVLLGTLEVVR
jgi:hypothetical protein